jgi:hypothetical protein
MCWVWEAFEVGSPSQMNCFCYNNRPRSKGCPYTNESYDVAKLTDELAEDEAKAVEVWVASY